MAQPQVGMPVQFNVAPGQQISGSTLAGGLITGITPDGRVNVRGFTDRNPGLLQRPDMAFQDGPAPGTDLTTCWPIPV